MTFVHTDLQGLDGMIGCTLKGVCSFYIVCVIGCGCGCGCGVVMGYDLRSY